MNQSEIERLREALRGLRAALGQLEAEAAGTMIDLRRLVADPTHARCIRCAEG